jgi:hypothetical protein
MATTSDAKTRRVKEVIGCIRNLTLNEFLVAFFSSEDPSIARQRGCSLAVNEGSRFASEELIDLWFKHCPPNSWSCLKEAIINRAGKIIISETDEACKMDSLCVPTTKIEAGDLDEDFLMGKLEKVYLEVLPYLWLLLNAIITSWNHSEKQKGKPSARKLNGARNVESQPYSCPTTLTKPILCGRPVSLS